MPDGKTQSERFNAVTVGGKFCLRTQFAEHDVLRGEDTAEASKTGRIKGDTVPLCLLIL